MRIRILRSALLALIAWSTCLAAYPQTQRYEFPALAYQDAGRYVYDEPSPAAACAHYASIWGWNRNDYSAALIQQLPGRWICQRYYRGAIEPSWYTSIAGQCQTSSATPLAWLSGRYVSYPSWDQNKGVCYCGSGTVFNSQIQWCEAGSARIDLYGASSTHALPAGPALPQTARVTMNGAPVSARSVSISIGGQGSLSGVTDAQGQFAFTYVPPYRKAVIDQITATCSGCINTAQKPITVKAAEMCERGVGGEP